MSNVLIWCLDDIFVTYEGEYFLVYVASEEGVHRDQHD